MQAFLNVSSEPNAIESSAERAAADVPCLKLKDGNFIPMLGYGFGTVNSRARKGNLSFDDDLVRYASQAIKAGFIHFDGSARYRNEAELGHAINKCGIPREQFFITTKTDAMSHMLIQEELHMSLERLGVGYVDLFLVHSPFYIDNAMRLQEVWASMEKIKESGMAKSIGVSNFMRHHLETLLETATVHPAINEIEFHPYLQHEDLLEFQRKHGIAVSAFGALVPLHRGSPGPIDGLWKDLAAKYGVTEAEIGLRWVIDQGMAVITTSTRIDRLESVMGRLFTFNLTPAEVEEIASLGRQRHFRGYWRKHLDANDAR